MKTITQLQNVAKRLPRLKKASQRILAKGRRGGSPLSDKQVGFHQARIIASEHGMRLLGIELFGRRVGLAPLRDTTTFKDRRAS